MTDTVPVWALAGHSEVRDALGVSNATAQRRRALVTPVAETCAGPIYDLRDFGVMPPPRPNTTEIDPSRLGGTSDAARALGLPVTTFAMARRRGSLPARVEAVKSLACTTLFLLPKDAS